MNNWKLISKMLNKYINYPNDLFFYKLFLCGVFLLSDSLDYDNG